MKGGGLVQGGRFGGRGPRGGRRRGGRGRFDEEDESSMTLAEWEARDKGGLAAGIRHFIYT